jgi:hypothetical protein
MNFKLLALSLIPALPLFFATPTKANPAPNLTVFNPSGYGASGGTGYIQADFQSRTRFTNKSDGEAAIGFGFGDAKSVALDLNYTFNSFGGSGKLGDGGFSVKAHRQIGNDSSVAIGWNQFANIGVTDYQKGSYYAVGTKVFATQDDVNKPFSRVAVTAGFGGGVFNQFNKNDNPRKVNSGIAAFGSVAARVHDRVSVIAEYTGQDIAIGLSVVPFKDVPLVITPAMRDIAGAGDGARFVVGASYGFRF